MRAFFVAIVVVAIGYLGWIFYAESKHPAPPARVVPTSATAATPETAPAVTSVPPSAPPGPATRSPLAPPGVYYAGERISLQTPTGVKALHPGEEVRLMYRYKDGTMLVTNGHDEFVVKPATLTKDREQAVRAVPR